MEDGEIEDAKISDPAAKGIRPTSTTQPDSSVENKATATSAPVIHTKPIQQDLGPPSSQLPLKPETPSSRHVNKPDVTNIDTKAAPTVASNDAIKPHHPPIPTRPDLILKKPLNTVNDRIPYNLPSRPEPPVSKTDDQRISERPGDRGPQDHGRDSRFTERGRSDRVVEASRDRLQDRSMPGSYNRGYDQNTERPHLLDRNRLESGWGDEKTLTNWSSSDDRHNGARRDSRAPSRDGRAERSQRDRSFPETSHHLPRSEFQGQPPREQIMAPPRSNVPQHSNPASTSHHSDRRSESSRYENFSNSGRSSRGGSPSRNEDRRLLRHEGRHDDRPSVDNRRPADASSHSQASRYESSNLPTGPRTDRSAVNSTAASSDKFRESMTTTSSAMLGPNPNLGRLNPDQGHHLRQEESQYGRLNSGPEIPSGPRLSNGVHLPPPSRGASSTAATLPRNSHQSSSVSTQALPPPLHIPDKQALGGVSTRSATRAASHFSWQDSTSSAPPTPLKDSPDTAGVHPDRLKAIQELGNPSPVDGASNQGSIRYLPHPLPLSTVSPGVRGPAQQAPNPVGPSPINRGPPTGPSFVGDRNRGDKRFAGLQNVLQQANSPNGTERSGQGASIRGRGGRANNLHEQSSSSNLGPPQSSVARAEGFAARGDLFAGRSGGPSTPPNEDDGGYGRNTRRGGVRENGREGERRSERHRGNRSHSRERGSHAPSSLREEDLAVRREDARERAGGRAPMEREMRRPGRDDVNRERRGEFDRLEMAEWAREERERDRRGDGGASGRKRGRGGEEGPHERNYTDGKRPRRTH